jgi:hypothetical protein
LLVIQTWILENNSKALPCLVLLFHWIKTVQPNGSARRSKQRRQHLDGGRFARSVGPKKREDLTSAHVERDSLDRGKRIKGLHQILYMNCERILWPTSTVLFCRKLMESKSSPA